MTPDLDTPVTDIFTSERLVYRGIEDNDADKDLFWELYSEPGTDALASSSIPIPPTHSACSILIKKHKELSMLSVFICLRDDTHDAKGPIAGKPIGVMSVKKPTFESKVNNRVAELGIFFAEMYRGKGFGEEALKWVLQWTFNFTSIHRLVVQSASYNTAAIVLWEKLGFHLDGRMRESVWFQRRWHDALVYSMLEQDWERANKSGVLTHQ